MTKYSYAYMHLPFQVPVLKLNLHRVLDEKTYKGIVMTESPAGVRCEFNGDVFTIPFVNFMLLVHERPLTNCQENVIPMKKDKKVA
jgi:hypothetical protein